MAGWPTDVQSLFCWQYSSLSAFNSSMRALFWFSKTATRFSRHLMYSFFLRLHSRAASRFFCNRISRLRDWSAAGNSVSHHYDNKCDDFKSSTGVIREKSPSIFFLVRNTHQVQRIVDHPGSASCIVWQWFHRCRLFVSHAIHRYLRGKSQFKKFECLNMEIFSTLGAHKWFLHPSLAPLGFFLKILKFRNIPEFLFLFWNNSVFTSRKFQTSGVSQIEMLLEIFFTF